MRILVTKLGDDLVKEMLIEHNETLHYKKIEQNFERQKRLNQSNRHKSNSSSKSPESLKSLKSPNRSFSNNHNNKNNKNSKSKHFKNESLRSIQKKIDQENKLFLDEDDLQNSKRINIKQKRLQIPKYLTEKYNADSRTGFILPDLTINKVNNNNTNSTNNKTRNINNGNFPDYGFDKSFNSNNKNNNNNNNYGSSMASDSKANYTFREIISENAYYDLLNKLKKEKKIKDALSRIDETKFRSVYGEKDKAQQFEGLLDKTINANKITLIKYINQKEKISDNFIKKICEGDDDKIIKANKICQIVFYNKEKDQLLNDIIKEKISHKKNKEKTEYKIGLEKMGETLKDFSSLLSDYDKKALDNKFNKYKDIHNDVANNYWRKFNVDNLMYKTIRLRSNARIALESRNANLSKTHCSFAETGKK